MNIALWVAQILLAAMFIMSGSMKAFTYEKAKASLPWAKDHSKGFVAFIGIINLLGGIGLILPGALDIAPILTGYAAIGIALFMLSAAIFHVNRKEYSAIGINAVLLLIALFVAVGRFSIEPF